MKKKFVFHFYGGEDWEKNEAVRLHLHCIKYFSNIFDDIVIVIASDNAENKPFLADIKHSLIDYIDCPSITLKTAENTPYREAKTFFDEVVNIDYDGIVFFGHTKGYTNFLNQDCDKERIRDWILGCYWLSLYPISDVESILALSTANKNALFFGSFQMIGNDNTDYLAAVYSGSFFWSNIAEIKKMLTLNEKKIPILSSRMSAEMFPGEVCSSLQFFLMSSYNAFRIYGEKCNFYTDNGLYGPLDAIRAISYNNTYEDFMNFRKKIIEESTL